MPNVVLKVSLEINIERPEKEPIADSLTFASTVKALDLVTLRNRKGHSINDYEISVAGVWK